MASVFFCLSYFRCLSKKRTVAVLCALCVVCVVLHLWMLQTIGSLPSVSMGASFLNADPLQTETGAKWKVKRTTRPLNTAVLTKVIGQNTFILSAIIPADQSDVNNTVIVINAFDGSRTTYYCCIITDNYEHIHVTRATLLRQHHQFIYFSFLTELFYSASYPASQIICPVSSRSRIITHVTLTSNTCSTHLTHYTPIVHASQHTGKLAVCGKVVYTDSLNPERLVEWFEFQKLLGVDKVLFFVLDIPDSVKRVFDLYTKEGFLTAVPYQLAGETERSFRLGNRSYPQFFHDEQLAIFDCRERLSGYSYVAGVDHDELIIPRSSQTLKQLLQNSLDPQYPDVGAYYFYQQFHILDWGPSHPNNTLVTLQYLQADRPRLKVQKFVYIPKRTAYTRTHEVIPKQDYRTYTIPPEVAVIHHFRLCPVTWNGCQMMHRLIDDTTLRYKKQLEIRFRNTMNKLNYRP